MADLLDQLALTSPLELVAVGLALIYLLLAARQHQGCWAAAIVSCAIYTHLMWAADLWMETLLQLCYVVLAIYGWYQWQYGAGRAYSSESHRAQFGWRWHVIAILVLCLCASVIALMLDYYTRADAVWLDTYTTVFSLFTTWLLTRKAIENWWYWLVIDSVYIYLYIMKEFYATAILFGLYVVLVVYAIWQWRQQRPMDSSTCTQSG